MSRHLDSSTETRNGQNHGPVWKTQSFLLSEICAVILLAGLLWERQFENILLKYGWKKVSNWDCLFVHREKGLFFSVHVDDIKLAGKKQSSDPMWKVLNKEVDLGGPTSFLDHVCWGCTQRQCERSKDIVDNYRVMFESQISAERTWKISILRELSYFFVILRYGRSCRVMCWTILWVGKQDDSTTQQSICDDHYFKEEETKSVGELSHVCSQIVLKCQCLARIGRPDILWSVNKLAPNGPELVTNV